MRGAGWGYVPDRLSADSPVLVLAQNPGADEERGMRMVGKQGRDNIYEPCEPQPLIGATGYWWSRHLLPLTGLARVSVANVLRCRWQHTNNLPPAAVLKPAVQHCMNAFFTPSSSVRLIVACGELAHQTLRPNDPFVPGSLGTWRGVRVLTTIHPAAIFQDPSEIEPAKADWRRVRQYLDRTWPRPLPPPVELATWYAQAMNVANAPTIYVDTEYLTNDAGRPTRLTLLGLYAPEAGVLQLQDGAWHDDRLRALACVPGRRWVAQNWLADWPVLRDHAGIELPWDALDDTMVAHSVLHCELAHDLGTVARLYSPYGQHKVLRGADQMAYNRGDLVATEAAWVALEAELAADPSAYQVYRRRMALLPMLQEAHDRGIALDQAVLEQKARMLDKQADTLQRQAHAAVGWPINLGSPAKLAHWLYTIQGYPVQRDPKTRRPTIEEEALTRLAVKVPDDPVIQARLDFAAVRQLASHYVTPLLRHRRCYPRFSLHVQTSGRWSTTDPPMSTLPRDGSMDDVFVPDPGEVWIGYDIDKAELWVMAAEADDATMLATLRSGGDIHTSNACAVFGWNTLPIDWKGKKDERRTFAKTYTHRLDYLGSPRRCLDIPKAAEMGFIGEEGARKLEHAALRYFARYPGLQRYHERMKAQYHSTWVARSWDGHRRVSQRRDDAAVRELINHPFQAGVAGVFDLTALDIYAKLKAMDKRSRFIYQAHDAAWWGVPQEHETTAERCIREAFERTFRINGHDIVFPIDMRRRLRAALRQHLTEDTV